MNKNHRESLCHLTVIVIPPNQAEEGWSLINTYFRHVPGESQISVIMSVLYIGIYRYGPENTNEEGCNGLSFWYN